MFAMEKYRLAGEKMVKLITLFSGPPSFYLLEDPDSFILLESPLGVKCFPVKKNFFLG